MGRKAIPGGRLAARLLWTTVIIALIIFGSALPMSASADDGDPDPEITTEPEITSEPEITPEPEVTNEPAVTPEPDVTSEPDTTPAPEVTTEPTATPTPYTAWSDSWSGTASDTLAVKILYFGYPELEKTVIGSAALYAGGMVHSLVYSFYDSTGTIYAETDGVTLLDLLAAIGIDSDDVDRFSFRTIGQSTGREYSTAALLNTDRYCFRTASLYRSGTSFADTTSVWNGAVAAETSLAVNAGFIRQTNGTAFAEGSAAKTGGSRYRLMLGQTSPTNTALSDCVQGIAEICVICKGIPAIQAEDVTIAAGESSALEVDISSCDEGYSAMLLDGLTYRSSDAEVVSVDENGVLSAKQTGEANITIEYPRGDPDAQRLMTTIGVTVVEEGSGTGDEPGAGNGDEHGSGDGDERHVAGDDSGGENGGADDDSHGAEEDDNNAEAPGGKNDPNEDISPGETDPNEEANSDDTPVPEEQEYPANGSDPNADEDGTPDEDPADDAVAPTASETNRHSDGTETKKPSPTATPAATEKAETDPESPQINKDHQEQDAEAPEPEPKPVSASIAVRRVYETSPGIKDGSNRTDDAAPAMDFDAARSGHFLLICIPTLFLAGCVWMSGIYKREFSPAAKKGAKKR